MAKSTMGLQLEVSHEDKAWMEDVYKKLSATMPEGAKVGRQYFKNLIFRMGLDAIERGLKEKKEGE